MKIYSGGKPEFIEADIFKQILPLIQNNEVQDRGQDTVQDRGQDTQVIKLLKFCEIPRTCAEMMEFLGLKGRASFRDRILKPLLNNDDIRMTIPEKPTSRNQRYISKK